MVKKLIQGLLNKKEGAPPAAGQAPAAEEPPAELPPLAEDTAQPAAPADPNAAQAYAEAPPASPDAPPADPAATPPAAPADPNAAPPAAPPAAEQPTDAPAELPPIEMPQDPAQQSADAAPALPEADTTQDPNPPQGAIPADQAPDPTPPEGGAAQPPAAPADPNAAPPAAPATPDAPQQPADAAQEPAQPPVPPSSEPLPPPPGAEPALPAEIQQAKQKQVLPPTLPETQEQSIVSKVDGPKQDMSFFSSVKKHLMAQDSVKEKLLSGDMFARMRNYWELKGDEAQSGTQTSTQERLEKNLLVVLDDLQDLEKKWQVQKLALAEDLKFLEQREREIQSKVGELRRLSNELSLFKNVEPHHYFRLTNGVVIKNLHDLIDMLEIMDDDTFHRHVGEQKNDFSDWVLHVFYDTHLAGLIKSAKTRAELISVLENTSLMEHHKKGRLKRKVAPTQYFFLANGVVVKSLPELLDALKHMDNPLYDRHVSDHKNDFAHWVRHILHEPELADHIHDAHSRHEIINAIEVYL